MILIFIVCFLTLGIGLNFLSAHIEIKRKRKSRNTFSDDTYRDFYSVFGNTFIGLFLKLFCPYLLVWVLWLSDEAKEEIKRENARIWKHKQTLKYGAKKHEV